MRRTLPTVLACLLASPLFAQEPSKPDPLVAARTRLQAALAKSAATPDTAYAAKLAEDRKGKQAEETMILPGVGVGSNFVSHGSWHAGLLHCVFEGDPADELLVSGRRTLAKAGDGPWALRSRRYADGNTLDFLPDPELLLERLAAWNLAIVHREVGTLDDRPVEIFTATLNPDQVAEATYAGLVPAWISGAGMNPFAVLVGMRNGGGRPPVAPPTSTVDLSIALDPATGLVHELHFRSWSKQPKNGGMAGRFVVVQGGAGGVRVQNGNDENDEDEEEKDAAEAKKDTEPKYENGLPVRPRKKTTVVDYTVKFTEHGKAKAPALDEAQKALLRL